MSQTTCPWCARPFTPSPKAFGVFCSRMCADAEIRGTPQRAMTFRSVQSRLHALNLPGARMATDSEQASYRRADAEALS